MSHLRKAHQEALDNFTFPMGERIKDLRRRNQMTLSELATRVDLPSGRVYEIECGKPIPLWAIKSFADALGVTVEVLMYGRPDQLPPEVEVAIPIRDVMVRLQAMSTTHRRYLLMYIDIILRHYGR